MESTRTTHTLVPSASGRHSGGYGAGAFTVSSLAFSSGGSMAGLRCVRRRIGEQGLAMHVVCSPLRRSMRNAASRHALQRSSRRVQQPRNYKQHAPAAHPRRRLGANSRKKHSAA